MHPRVAVITPTTGYRTLGRCLDSVARQTVPVTHVLVVDGEERRAAVEAVVTSEQLARVTMVTVPFITGKDHYNGHRIYAALPWLLPDFRYIALLDEDNWFASNHIETLLASMEATCAEWAHSLRNICDDFTAEHLLTDESESLGLLHDAWGHRGACLIDTSCIIMSRKVALETCPKWESPTFADRHMTHALMTSFPGICTKQHTMNYAVRPTGAGSSQPNQPRGFTSWQHFFAAGNEHLGCPRWSRKVPLYVFCESPEASDLACNYSRHKTSVLHAELGAAFALLDGHRAEAMNQVPKGAVCLFQGSSPCMTMNRQDVIRIARPHTGSHPGQCQDVV